MHTPDLYWFSKNIKLYDRPYLRLKGTTFRNNMNHDLDFFYAICLFCSVKQINIGQRKMCLVIRNDFYITNRLHKNQQVYFTMFLKVVSFMCKYIKTKCPQSVKGQRRISFPHPGKSGQLRRFYYYYCQGLHVNKQPPHPPRWGRWCINMLCGWSHFLIWKVILSTSVCTRALSRNVEITWMLQRRCKQHLDSGF